MSLALNSVHVGGYLGDAPALTYTTSGRAKLEFSVATTERWKDANQKECSRTDWHTVNVWGKRAEALAKILHKGSGVVVEGRLRCDRYEKDGQTRYKHYVQASEVHLADKAPKAEHQPPANPAGYEGDEPPPGHDNIPF